MPQSLMQQKQLQKQELQRECRKIEEVLREITLQQHLNLLLMKNDAELIDRCHHVHNLSVANFEKMQPYGITQADLANFHVLIARFSMLVEDISNKTNELYGKSTM